MNRVRMALDALQPERASKAEWQRRGWKVKKGQSLVQYIKVWNGMYFNRIKIYDIRQCEPIRGDKAAQRREEWVKSIGVQP